MTEAQESGGADSAPIVSVGADVDVESLVAEIKAEVARKADAGLYPPELMVHVNRDPLAMAVMALRDGMCALVQAIASRSAVVGRCR